MSNTLKLALGSIILLAMGLYLLKSEVFDNLAAAAAHREVAYHEKALFLAPALLLLSLAGFVGVAFGDRTFQPRSRPRPSGGKPTIKHQLIALLIVAVLGGIGFALRWWFLGRLASLGFQAAP